MNTKNAENIFPWNEFYCFWVSLLLELFINFFVSLFRAQIFYEILISRQSRTELQRDVIPIECWSELSTKTGFFSSRLLASLFSLPLPAATLTQLVGLTRLRKSQHQKENGYVSGLIGITSRYVPSESSRASIEWIKQFYGTCVSLSRVPGDANRFLSLRNLEHFVMFIFVDCCAVLKWPNIIKLKLDKNAQECLMDSFLRASAVNCINDLRNF